MQLSPVRINEFCNLMVDETNWGDADISVLIQIFRTVIEEFRSVSGIIPSGVLNIQPSPGFDYPLCSKTGDSYTIFLTARGNHWSQYVFQFSHEYCHYLINGPLDGKLETSFWFEESICELASMFFLNRATIRWNAYQYVKVPGVPMSSSDRVLNDLKGYVKNNQEYLRNRRNLSSGISIPLASWLEENMHSLSEPVYHRDLYNKIADSLLDLFIDNHDLWRILPYLYRPSLAEYSGFREFITQIVPNRLTVEVEHFPLLVEVLTGDTV